MHKKTPEEVIYKSSAVDVDISSLGHEDPFKEDLLLAANLQAQVRCLPCSCNHARSIIVSARQSGSNYCSRPLHFFVRPEWTVGVMRSHARELARRHDDFKVHTETQLILIAQGGIYVKNIFAVREKPRSDERCQTAMDSVHNRQHLIEAHEKVT